MRKLKLQELGRHTVESFSSEVKQPITIVLDDIRSALNVGSVFRTADAMAIEQVVLCGITPQPPSRDITKTAIGATKSVKWTYVEHIKSALEKLRSEGYTIISIEQTSESVELLKYADVPEKLAIIMGNEVNGVSEAALELTDTAIELAQYGTKHSLNVSVCAGIVMHHFGNIYRRRLCSLSSTKK